MTRITIHAALVLVLVAASSLHAGILFSEGFGGGAGNLDGATPDVTTAGANWVASANFNRDGTTDDGPGSATLAFTPLDGLVYTLDASFSGFSANPGDTDWFAVGFVNGQSAASTTNDRFITGNVVGTAWMMHRGDFSLVTNTSFLGTGQLGTGNNGLGPGGVNDGIGWSLSPPEDAVDMRVVLDTTGGPGAWTATWYARRPGDAAYTEVRPTATLSAGTTIGAVGVARSNPGVSGTVESFSLSDNAGGPDTTPPALSATEPANGVAGVVVDANLTATFSEPITAGTGDITLKRTGDDGVVDRFDAASSTALTFDGATLTIDPTTDLDPGVRYYVQIADTAIEDGAGNRFAGIADSSSWNFTTASGATGSLAPYTVDADTLHLWHFDEPDPGPAAPAPGVTGSFSLAPESGAALGVPSLQGFGTAGDTSAGSAAGFRGATIPVGEVTGADGAFTIEALIRTPNINDAQQIVTMENGGAASDRPFQFRIDAGNLRFINVTGGVQQIVAPIPTTGPDAFVPDEWFHAAVTYNGSENTAANTRLYWTRVTAARTGANEILSTVMTSDISGISTILGVGQEYRSPSDNLEGRIDEVRISGIARAADAFLFRAPDTDGDGLADPWEILHFRESPSETEAVILAKFAGGDDPDDDTFDNEAEETAGTDPNDPDHTPLDADRDGYPDAWELATFGTISHGPGDDPDGDGWTTDEELTAGTDPANPLSNPHDTDADGLEDATELALFGNLDQGPLSDFDGDGVSNLAELQAGTDPTDPDDFPEVSFIPVTDGNSSTDENGYAGSGINSVAFAQNNLLTVGSRQVIAYYRRHATDPGHPDNNTVVIGRRNLAEAQWELFPTNFRSFNIDDAHNVISCAIDGDGILHMSWGMHGNPLLYARSTATVLGSEPIVMTSLGAAGMTGQENSVTYPKFQTLPDGDVVFLFREGGSGSGDWYLHRYDTDTDAWAPIHANGSGVHQPLMKGRGDSPDNCFYPDRMTLGPDGMLHLAGVFRYNGDSPAGESGYQTNHRYVYLRSPDGGTTWQRSDGSSIDLPVVEAAWFQGLGASHVPEIVEDIPEGHSNMNEAGMTTDSAGRPIIANWWAVDALSGDHTRQYHVYFHDGATWHRRTVSARTVDNPSTKFSEGALGSSWMGRPVVLTDADDRIIVLYNDNRFDGITVVFSGPLAQDPERNHWTRMNLTNEQLGRWEATYDEPRWKRDGVLHMLYQRLPGSGVDYGAQNDSTPVSVLEWNARAYFNSPIRWAVDTTTTPGQAAVRARTRVGFRYDLRTGTDLLFGDPPAATRAGDGSWRDFGNWPMNEPRRFWRMERSEEATDDL